MYQSINKKRLKMPDLLSTNPVRGLCFFLSFTVSIYGTTPLKKKIGKNNGNVINALQGNSSNPWGSSSVNLFHTKPTFKMPFEHIVGNGKIASVLPRLQFSGCYTIKASGGVGGEKGVPP